MKRTVIAVALLGLTMGLALPAWAEPQVSHRPCHDCKRSCGDGQQFQGCEYRHHTCLAICKEI